MRPARKLTLLVGIALAVAFVWLMWDNKVLVHKGIIFSRAANMESQKPDKKVDNPCWFRSRAGLESASDDMIKKLRERQIVETYGYATDTPLSEAVKIFNEELQCSPLYREYPPLTEDEVIAAIVASVNDNNRGTTFLAERDILWKIATQKMLPKGSILRFASSGRVTNSPLRPSGIIQAKGIEIFLLLGLDKNGKVDLPLPPKLEEILTIRKTFSGIEIINE